MYSVSVECTISTTRWCCLGFLGGDVIYLKAFYPRYFPSVWIPFLAHIPTSFLSFFLSFDDKRLYCVGMCHI